MTRDGVPPPAPAPAGGAAGDGSRRCSQCGHHGHNARTCTARGPVKLFGVRIGDKPPIRKSASMGNLAQLAAEGSGGGGARAGGYGSEGDDDKPHRKRGESWSEEEHKIFLLGLKELGRGDWRGISRNYVVSRTPTQVASHAQKYFIRQSNVHRRKRRSSLFDMVIDDSGDRPLSRSSSQEIPLSRSSSQEVEEYIEDLQPVSASVPVLTSVSVPPTVPVVPPPMPVTASPAPVLTNASAPPVPAMAHHPEENESAGSSSNTREAGTMMPQVMHPYGYPVMFLPPHYAPAFYPVPYYGYAPMFYGPPVPVQASSQATVQASHELVRPVAAHSGPQINVEDLYGMSELSLKGNSNTNSVAPNLQLPPKPNGTTDRRSAFHAKAPANGSSNGLIPAK